MRDKEIVGLWEAYLQVHQPKEEVEQLDEDFPKQVGDFLKRGGDELRKRLPGVAAALTTGKGGTVTAAQQKAKIKPVGEEVENWVNSLIDEGYDLSEYTWEDMYEMYVNLDEEAPERITKRTRNKRLMKNAGPARVHNPNNMGEETNLFDTILEYLVAEGYADTNESALAIMANMSEEWRESIVEAIQIPRPAPQKYMNMNSGSGSVAPKPDMSTPQDKIEAQRIKNTPLGARLTSPGGPVRNPGPATGPNGFLNRNR
jgi:hypothetical protein